MPSCNPLLFLHFVFIILWLFSFFIENFVERIILTITKIVFLTLAIALCEQSLITFSCNFTLNNIINNNNFYFSAEINLDGLLQ